MQHRVYNMLYQACALCTLHVHSRVESSANTSLSFVLVICVLYDLVSIDMGSWSSRFQPPSLRSVEVAEAACSSRKHGCECKKRKRNASSCDCDSEHEDDPLLDTPRR